MDEENIFLKAVEIDSGAERTAFLDQACGNDRQMRASLDSLLKHHSVAGRFLEVPPVELQQTFAPGQSDTVSDSLVNRTLDRLEPTTRPGCLGLLGQYEILEVIGRGGMGIVLRACDAKLQRVVAIKLMNETLASSPQGLKRFLREAQAAAAVQHENVVTIHAVHDEGPLPYLVMELVEGDSLERKLEHRQPLSTEEIMRIGSQLAAGLRAAHERGLVHRDIKPANILLEAGTQRVKITDFGLARAVSDAGLTREGDLAGTPQYMSPEQARGQTADQRSDLFSLGSVLYTLCTGRPPFPAESAVAALRGICDDCPRAIRELNPQIPPWLEAVVNQLLRKDPQDRPQTAAEVLELLTRHGQPSFLRTGSSDGLNRRTLLVLGGAIPLAALVLAGVILIVNFNGKQTRVNVPDGAKATVSKDGKVEVELPGESAVKEPPRTATAPLPIREVVAKLVELNPQFDGQVNPTVENDEVVELQLSADHLKDITPLASLTKLRSLTCTGSSQGSGQLNDLTPLKGLSLTALNVAETQVSNLAALAGMPLARLDCAGTKVSDLTPLADMPLAMLHLQRTPVASLSPLHKVPLVDLNLSFTQVTDITPLKDMQLDSLYCDVTRIADLSPLSGMPLKNLNWRGYDQSDPRHVKVVKSLTTLESIDSLPAAEFWQKLEAKGK